VLKIIVPMRNFNKTVAVYTTIYPGAQEYLADWYRSIIRQTDTDFALWIGLDTLPIRSTIDAMGCDPQATWIEATPGSTPAEIRQRAFEQIVDRYDIVVLVDSDDILHESRIASARESLGSGDLAGCALQLVDHSGKDLGLIIRLPFSTVPEDVFPRNNIFGLSNSAFRSDLLSRCLPIRADAVVVDWFLTTRAWLLGARFVFDNVARMYYRQHGSNMTHIMPPFSSSQVENDCRTVLHHFELILNTPFYGAMAERLAMMEIVHADIMDFQRRVVNRPAIIEQYVEALNGMELTPLWWSCVANPALKHMWSPSRR
jgi:hypothetical protein